jgi:hypothetical protein
VISFTHFAALSLGRKPLVPVEQGVGWNPKLVWKFQRRPKRFSPVRNRNYELLKRSETRFFAILSCFGSPSYRGADKSLARPGRKQTTATEDFDFHIYPTYNHNWRNIIYIYNKTSIKRNILTIKQNTSGSRSG